VVGTQADDVPNSYLRPTDEIDDPNDYQDQDECSKTDVHSSRLSRVAGCATHRIRRHTLRSCWQAHRGAFVGPRL